MRCAVPVAEKGTFPLRDFCAILFLWLQAYRRTKVPGRPADAARSDACSNARAVEAARAVGFVKVVICASSFYFLKLKCCMAVRAAKTAPDRESY